MCGPRELNGAKLSWKSISGIDSGQYQCTERFSNRPFVANETISIKVHGMSPVSKVTLIH